MEKAFFEYCKRDPLHYIALTEPARLGLGNVLYAEGDGVVLDVDGLRFLSAQTDEAAERLFPYVENAENAALFEDWLVDRLLSTGRFSKPRVYHNVMYAGREQLPEFVPEGFSIRKLTRADAPEVIKNYEAFPDPDYIYERIGDGMLGAFSGEKLAGFMGTHDEGSMGLLEVLPEFRRCGLAEALERRLINLQLSRHRVPFGQVAPDNAASMNLQKKLGLTVSGQAMYWFWEL